MSGLPSAWKKWVLENLLKGVSASSLHRTLMQNGFHHEAAMAVLGNNLESTFSYALDSNYYRTLSEPAFLRQHKERVVNHSNDQMQLFEYPRFLNETTCLNICELTKLNLRPSEISTKSASDKQTFRTSSTCDLSMLNQEISQAVDAAIIALFGEKFGPGEPIQAQHYATGQEFKAHTDYFEPGTKEYQTYCSVLGQRTWTCMVYLNENCEGGETEFNYLGEKFSPRSGKAIIWNNLTIEGRVNPHTQHQAHPVTKGEKTVITKWFRAAPIC